MDRLFAVVLSIVSAVYQKRMGYPDITTCEGGDGTLHMNCNTNIFNSEICS